MDYALGRMANGVMASRMDPPMNEDWRSWHIVRVMFTLRHGSIIPTIFPRVLLVQVPSHARARAHARTRTLHTHAGTQARRAGAQAHKRTGM